MSAKYSVVIPTLNESGNIAELMRRIESVLKNDFEIIVVDENSPDGTFDIAKEYGKGKNYIRPMLNDGERGLSPSIVKGFHVAEGEFLCCMDGDLQHDENCLVNMFKAAENADMQAFPAQRFHEFPPVVFLAALRKCGESPHSP